MMKIISHRGNLFGSSKERENNFSAIKECFIFDFDVEVDVWYYKNNYYLGHDKPTTCITKEFLLNEKLWCHAKNLDALKQMLEDKIHCFWHQNDDYTLTSRGYIWTYPGKEVSKNSVIVSNEKIKQPCFGVCTDYPIKFKNEKDS